MLEIKIDKIVTPTIAESYEERFIAFLDILGWRKQVEASKADQSLIRKLGAVLAHLKGASGKTILPLLEFSQFSDCIIISTLASEFNISKFLSAAMGINQVLLYLGFLVRGGITKGLVYHNGSVAFGQALTRAYDLERLSVYPRIILDHDIEQLFLDSQNFTSNGINCQFKWIRRSPDGFYFLDFLQSQNAQSIVGQEEAADGQKSPPLHFLRDVREMIARNLRDHHDSRDIRTWEKYRWTAEYFNEVVLEYSEANMEMLNEVKWS
jgi:hypothetical protein